MKNRKICCLLIPSLQGNGAENIVLNLYRALTEHENFECHIIYVKDIVELEVEDNIKLHYIPEVYNLERSSKFFKRRKQAKIIEHYILENIGRPNLVLSNLTLMDKISKHLRFKKTYNIIHSNTSTEHLGSRTGIKRVLARFKINNIYRKHNCICVSKGVLDDLQKNFNIKRNKSVIYNPINTNALIEKKNNITSYTVDDEYLIHIGKFNDAKRHDRLIEAYKKSNIDTKLVLVGKGCKEDKIINIIKRLDLKDMVILPGFQKNPYPLLAGAKGFILSSDYEGLPTVILEALALNVPVVSTNCPSGPNEILPESSLSELNVDSLSEKIKQLDANPDNFKVALKEEFTMKFAAAQYAKLC